MDRDHEVRILAHWLIKTRGITRVEAIDIILKGGMKRRRRLYSDRLKPHRKQGMWDKDITIGRLDVPAWAGREG